MNNARIHAEFTSMEGGSGARKFQVPGRGKGGSVKGPSVDPEPAEGMGGSTEPAPSSGGSHESSSSAEPGPDTLQTTAGNSGASPGTLLETGGRDGSEAAAELHAQLRAEKAELLVHQNMLAAMGLGVLPFPVIDAVAITGLQVKMLHDLGLLYGVEFASTQAVRSIVGSLTAGLGLPLALAPLVMSVFKVLPGLGALGGFVSFPLVAGATTYALGQVFIQHFASGGTLLDLQASGLSGTVRAHYEKGLKKARELSRRPVVDPPKAETASTVSPSAAEVFMPVPERSSASSAAPTVEPEELNAAIDSGSVTGQGDGRRTWPAPTEDLNPDAGDTSNSREHASQASVGSEMSRVGKETSLRGAGDDVYPEDAVAGAIGEIEIPESKG